MAEMNPAARIRRELSAFLKPLGEGRGREHTQYVSRWKTRAGIPVVCENGYPNVWLTNALFARLSAPDPEKLIFENKLSTTHDRGFHSNVMKTPGMNGSLVKLSPRSDGDTEYLLEYLRKELTV